MYQRYNYNTRHLPFISFIKALILSVLLLIIFLSPAGSAFGGDYTNVEKAGFAFYKLSDIEPDFDSWIKNTKEYQKIVRPRERAEFLSERKFRLEQGLNTYVPEFDLITIKTPIILQGMPAEQFKRTNERYINIMLDIESSIRSLYFPVPVGKEWIAIVPRNIEKYDKLKVTADIYNTIIGASSMASTEGIKRKGSMEVIIQPISVDTKAPLRVDDIDLWLMAGEIASISIWSGKKQNLVWEYTAPWYVSDMQRGLHSLYGK